MKEYKTNQGSIITIYDNNEVFDSGKGYIGKIDQYGCFHSANGNSSYRMIGNDIVSNEMKNVGTILGGQITTNKQPTNNQQSGYTSSGGSDLKDAVSAIVKYVIMPLNLIALVMGIIVAIFLICSYFKIDILGVLNSAIDSIRPYLSKYSRIIPIAFEIVFFGVLLIVCIIKIIIKILRKK